MKKVVIHQPNYLPWIGYFQKISSSDIFIILDDVQFSKDSFTQRTKIRTPNGWMWLTIPIQKNNNFNNINQVLLPSDSKWLNSHWKSIVANYSKSKYFNQYGSFFEELYLNNNIQDLQAFNEKIILYLLDVLKIDVEVFRSSDFELDSLKGTDLLIELVKKVDGDCYISGMGGNNYMDTNLFSQNNIKLEYFKYKPFEYEQRWDGFEPYMSIIDLLFNCGDEFKSEIF
ncbi:MAG: WbqC family protein [Methanococcoides sp.]|nr:WbqC family protein [Methanococcoides sp.]